MKAAVVPGKGQGLKVQEVPDPKPGKGEVLIKVTRAALCYRDLLQLQGYYPRMKYPVVLGHEVVGVIQEVGEGVNFSPGERVISLSTHRTARVSIAGWGRRHIAAQDKVTRKNWTDSSPSMLW